MAKKKSSNRKKHSFQHSAVVQNSTSINQEASTPSATIMTARPSNTSASVVQERDFSYVGHDVKRLGILAFMLIAIEIILWLLFRSTHLGTTIYSLAHT